MTKRVQITVISNKMLMILPCGSLLFGTFSCPCHNKLDKILNCSLNMEIISLLGFSGYFVLHFYKTKTDDLMLENFIFLFFPIIPFLNIYLIGNQSCVFSVNYIPLL